MAPCTALLKLVSSQWNFPSGRKFYCLGEKMSLWNWIDSYGWVTFYCVNLCPLGKFRWLETGLYATYYSYSTCYAPYILLWFFRSTWSLHLWEIWILVDYNCVAPHRFCLQDINQRSLHLSPQLHQTWNYLKILRKSLVALLQEGKEIQNLYPTISHICLLVILLS